MPTISEALSIAMAHHQAGRLDLAEEIYGRILAAEPRHADALHMAGVAALQQGDYRRALEYVDLAIEADPAKGHFHNTRGEAHRRQGNLTEALACYEQAIRQGPDRAEYHNNLGIAARALDELDRAAACFRRAIVMQPDLAEAHHNLGNLLSAQGRRAEAIACYRQTLELQPNLPGVRYDLATAFHALGKLPEALDWYGRSLELEPGRADAWFGRGNAAKDLGRLADAEACYRRALELTPDHLSALNNLGAALRAQDRPREAIECLGRALAVAPQSAEVHGNLGNALKDQGRLAEALQCYRRAVELQPASAAAHSNLVYLLHFCPEYDARAIAGEHRGWDRAHAQAFSASIRPHANDRSPERRIRIGYLSPHLREHVIGRNMAPLLREHDHQAFEIFSYNDHTVADPLTDRLRACCDEWREVAGLGDEEVASHVRDDRIDILVDLTLHLEGNRLLVFARKPAPVQVTFAGYPGTTGLAAIDYRLTDPYLDPPGHDDDCYAEQSIRLADSFWCYEATDDSAVTPLPAAAQGFVTFGCLNNFCKINPGVLKLWARVLRRVDRSRLLLLAAEGPHRDWARELLAAEGVPAERVSFANNRPHREYLKLYGQIDLALDTTPYNGHTTSLDALWMGVPVVTLVGRTVVGRAGLSQSANLGLAELVAETDDQFVDIAVRLANDLSRLSTLRATLRERMEHSPLMDAPRFARNVEAAYRSMWRHWCTSQ